MLDKISSLYISSDTECPTTSALTLVLDLSHGSLLSPVKLFGKSNIRNVCWRPNYRVIIIDSSLLPLPQRHSSVLLELHLGQIREECGSVFCSSLLGLPEELDFLHVLFEHSISMFIFLP